jgi:lipid II isoglutaminyl synthase (glutamine-hydrolysing)
MSTNTKYTITIGWLYPQLMSTYGDRGNILVLQKRCEGRGINVEVLNIDQTTTDQRLMTIDLLFGGGAQDREQEIVMKDLLKKKHVIKKFVENEKPALFVCGAPQLMGNYYEPAEGKRIEGLGIFDMVSKHPGPKQDRLIGNVVANIILENLTTNYQLLITEIVGFENHGGRTYLGKSAKPFATVVKGFGNNGDDGTEGVVYKNAIGSYLHGPLLPKNPQIADLLITKALEIKYKKEITLEKLDDSLEQKAKEAIANRLGIRV